MTNVFKTTAQFNQEVCGLRPQSPKMLDPERLQWFATAVREELDELLDAKDLHDQADAVLDLIYFAAGRVYEMGIDGAKAFAIIHTANMLKERGSLAKRPGSRGHDAIKPPGWVSPDLTSALVRRPKFLILGYGRHGKDTVCEMISGGYGLAFQSSSMFCAEHVMMPHFASIGKPYDTVEQCYADRHSGSNRAVWYDQIQDYNIPDGARLATEMMQDHDIYCGMRSASELVACVKANVFDHIAWVDRSQHEPPEDISSCTVTREMADYVIDNNGTIDDLVREVRNFMEGPANAQPVFS